MTLSLRCGSWVEVGEACGKIRLDVLKSMLIDLLDSIDVRKCWTAKTARSCAKLSELLVIWLHQVVCGMFIAPTSGAFARLLPQKEPGGIGLPTACN